MKKIDVLEMRNVEAGWTNLDNIFSVSSIGNSIVVKLFDYITTITFGRALNFVPYIASIVIDDYENDGKGFHFESVGFLKNLVEWFYRGYNSFF